MSFGDKNRREILWMLEPGTTIYVGAFAVIEARKALRNGSKYIFVI